MARSSTKTVLFCVGKDGRSVRQWPVAVFPSEPPAKSFAAILRLAYRSGDTDAVKRLDSTARFTDAGELLKDVKFSLIDLPYAPTPDLEDEEATEEQAPAA